MITENNEMHGKIGYYTHWKICKFCRRLDYENGVNTSENQ